MDAPNFDGLVCFKIERTVGRSSESGIHNCLVLESDTTPDYYAWKNFPPEKHVSGKRLVYLLVKNRILCFQDIVLRHNAILSAHENDMARISPGYMSFQNEHQLCIRIKLSQNHLPDNLIGNLKNIGMQFFSDRKVKNFSSYIHYKYYAEFDRISDGMYQDRNDPHRFLLPITQYIDIRDLKPWMDEIKSNSGFYLFDSFLAETFLHGQFIDFIGVYSDHCDEGSFWKLRQEIEGIFATSDRAPQSPADPYQF
ncbi:MAG: hypothetical protein ACOCX8_00725 [Bacteroidota bacterium]